MKLTSCLVAVLLLSLLPVSASGQLEAAAEGPVAIGHHHLNAADVEASKRFWVDLLGAELVQLGPLEVLKLPNLLVALTPKAPEGGSFGSSVNHIGLQMPDVEAMVTKLAAAGIRVVTQEHIPPAEGDVFEIEDQNTKVAFVESPAGLRVELYQNAALERAIENHHIHFYTDDPEATQAWYVRMFNAAPRMRGSFLSADLPGVNLTFSEGDTVGTQGRALDHIGFEVRDLEGLCRILEGEGVVFDRPYTHVEQLDLEFAFFTDPWGNYVELTEGLDEL